MSPQMIGALVALVIILAGVAVAVTMRREHTDVLERLDRHRRRLKDKAPEVEAENIFSSQKSDYLARLLAEAGMEAQYDTMKQAWTMSAVLCGALFCVLMMGVMSELWWLGLFVGLPVGAAGFTFYLKILAKRRQAKMTEQLPQVLETMVSSLRAGSPVLEVFKTLAETVADPIGAEFRRSLISLQLGKPFRDVMGDMAMRIRTADFRLLTQAIFISQDVGANLADVVASIADSIRERFKLRDFMNSLTAQGKMTALFIGLLPYGITAVTYLMSPAYIIPFLNHPIARIVFFALIVWEFIGFWLLMKLTTFEVI